MQKMNWPELAMQTITAPERAAERVIDLHVSNQGLLYGLIALSALNGIYFGLNPDAAVLLGPLSNMSILLAVAHGVLTYAFAWVSHVIAGVFGAKRGGLWDILKLLIWLKAVNLLVQVSVTLAGFVLPLTALGFMSIGILLYSLYILSVFYEKCFGFESVWMGFATYIVASLGVAMIILIFIIALGGGARV